MFGSYAYLFNLFAASFLIFGQILYINQVIRRNIVPSLFTWMGWSVLVGVSLISQIIEYGWNWSMTGHLFSAIGCTAIFLFAWFTRNFVIRQSDWKFLYLGMACVLLYLLFKDPWSTTIFAILADAILGIPTIYKAWLEPKTERTIGWNIALSCWTLTMISCLDKSAIYMLFPAYCFLFNAVMSYLTTRKRIDRMLLRS